jgi:DNA-binding transcriptional regulator YiaG
MLDALEARVARLRGDREVEPGARQEREPGANGGLDVHALFEEVGLPPGVFADTFHVDFDVMQAWLDGARPVPQWVEPSLKIFGALPQRLRRQWLARRDPGERRDFARSHPFSRIEEL